MSLPAPLQNRPMRSGKVAIGHPVNIATGVVHSTHRDIFVPGRVDLTWDRRYSTDLLGRPSSPLGPGWTTRYFATLTRQSDGFRFVTPEGEPEVFVDRGEVVEQGGVVRKLGTFQELARDKGRYVVTRWNNETGEVERYVFTPGRPGSVWPLTSIEDPTGQGLDISLESGKLLSVRQRLENRVLLVEYDESGTRIAAVMLQTPDGQQYVLMRYTYDGDGRLSSALDALDNADRYEYRADSRISREVVKDGGVFSFHYDSQGRCIRTAGLERYDEKRLRFFDTTGWTAVTNSLGEVTRYQWTAVGQVTQIMDSLGALHRTEYDEHGRITAQIAANAAISRFEFDEEGNRSRIVDPLGHKYIITYNRSHLPLTVTDPEGHVWRREYDGSNRIVATEDPLGGRWLTTYDAHGNPVEVTAPSGARKRQAFSPSGILLEAMDWMGNPTRYTVDGFGRVTEYVGPSGDTTRTRYDVLGNLLEIGFPDDTRVSYTYDRAGNVLQVTDANGHTTRYRFGPCHRLLERTDWQGGSVRLKWSTEPRRLERVVNEKNETYTFTYNAAGLVVQEKAFDGREQAYQYDLTGRPSAVTNGSGETVTLRRDPIGRLVEQIFPDGSTATFAYDAIGNLIAAINADCVVRFERDALGRVVREMQDNVVVENQFNAMGNLIHSVTSLGYDASYEVDHNGALLRLILDRGKHVMQFGRNTRGQETSRILPGGVRLDQRYDVIGNLIDQRLSLSPALRPRNSNPTVDTVVTRRYSYDHRRAIVAIADNKWGQATYAYDADQRLLSAKHNPGVGIDFGYDAAGNLIQVITEDMTAGGISIESLQYDQGDRLVQKGNTSYLYDDHGRVTWKVEATASPDAREWRYSWDALDRLRSIRTPSGQEWRYTYDALGRRVTKDGGAQRVRFVWAGDVVVHHVVDDRRVDTWVFQPDSFVPMAKLQGGNLYSVVADPAGRPRELVDARGAIVWWAGPTSWPGLDERSDGQVDCPIRFQGQWYDPESGLHYNRFRYYDPQSGRFISPDPIGLAGGLNLYAYGPNPFNWIDPWGWSSFRGAKPGEAPSFDPKPNEYKVKDGMVQPTHGVSVFDNAASVQSKGFVPHEIDPATVPSTLQIKQRGKDPAHQEIMPKAPMTEEDYKAALAQIKTTPPSPPTGSDDDESKPKQDGCD